MLLIQPNITYTQLPIGITTKLMLNSIDSSGNKIKNGNELKKQISETSKKAPHETSLNTDWEKLLISRVCITTHLIPGIPIQGLTNIGSTCYLNSVLQALCASPILRNLINENQTGIIAKNLKNIFDTIISTSKSVDITENVLSTINFLLSHSSESIVLQNLKQSLEQTATSQQQDVHELLSMLLDGIATESSAKKNVFTGEINLVTTGTMCTHTSTKTEPFTILSLPIQSLEGKLNFTSLDQSLAKLSEPETLSNENKWNCPISSKEGDSSSYVEATRQITLKTLPQILFIQLKIYFLF